ncbi:MAG: VCBS repeat-containing protein [Nitrospirae bacterium]|nr:VCBS repeat-containing protein [Nitrospirota bacterium]
MSIINSYRSNVALNNWERLAHQRRYDRAEELINKALKYNPENVKAWTALGDVYLITEEYREARLAYEEALRLDRDAFEAYSGLMAVELEESGYSDVIKDKISREIEAYKNTGERNAKRLMAVFNVLNFLHEYDKAAEIAEEIMKLSPDEKTSETLSGFLSEELLSEKDVDKRLIRIEHFLSLFPSAKESFMVNHLRLGILQKDLKNRDLLFKFGEEWLKKEPENRRANFSVGYWYTEEGISLESAVLHIRKALDLMVNPDLADKPDHYPEIEWLKDLKKTTGIYYSTLGLAYYKLGQKEMAEEAYIKGTQYLEYDKELYFRLGNILEERGDALGAVNAYVQALKSGENKEAEERLLTLTGSDAASTNKFYAIKEGITSFTDVTADAGLQGIEASRIAWGDFNNDGYEDLMLNGALLLKNNGNGTFTDTTASAGIKKIDGANGGIWGDIDNNSFIDFYTFAKGSNNIDRLWKNNGDETFTDITLTAFTDVDNYPTEAAAWVDYDKDGFIDLYLANYERPLHETIDRARGTPDRLFHNNGNGTFDDVSMISGITLRENMCGRGVSWGDYDNDGDSDIYVSNYRLDPNLLWNNNGDGTFSNKAEEKGVEGDETEGAYGHTIGSEWGDYDNDGDLDLFVSNLAHPRYIGYSDKSMLLENQGPPRYNFINRFGDSGIRFEETSADPSFIDYDNDGFLDIFFTSTYKDRNSFLYKGNGDGTFKDVTWLAGVRVDDGWGDAFADFDNDGDMDLAIGGGAGLKLFRNDGNEHHWLHVKVVGRESNYSGIGARVIIRPGEVNPTQTTTKRHPEPGLLSPGEETTKQKTDSRATFKMQMREVQGGKGSGSQHSLPVEFGLGDYSGLLDLEVLFPSGKAIRLNGVTPDQLIIVDERAEGEPSVN